MGTYVAPNNKSQSKSTTTPTPTYVTKEQVQSMINSTLGSKTLGSLMTATELDQQYVRRDSLSGLIPWKAAYANREKAPARICVISDLEGGGSTAPNYFNSWHRILERYLRGARQGGLGFLPAAYKDPSMVNALTVSGATTARFENKGTGRTLSITAGGRASSPNTTMTSFRIWYTKNNFFDTSANINVDGGTTITKLDSNNPGGLVPAQCWPLLSSAPYPIAGNHVVNVVGNGPNPSSFELDGIEIFNGDENSGVHLYDMTYQGATTFDVTSDGYKAGYLQYLKVLQPQLVIVMLGHSNWGVSEVDFTTWSINTITQLIDQYVKTPHTILFVSPYKPVKNSKWATEATWADYVNTFRKQAQGSPDHVAFFDLQEVWPRLKQGGSTNMGLMVETDYPRTPSQAGHQYIADTLARLLS